MIGRNSLELAASYRSFAALLNAGFGPHQAIEVLAKSAKAEQRPRLDRIAAVLDRGGTLAEALASLELPQLDVAVVDAGERTGSLVETTRHLEAHYQTRMEIEAAVRRAIPRPAMLIVAAVLSATVPAAARGDVSFGGFAFWTAAPLALLFGLIWGGFEIARRALFSREVRRRIDWTFKRTALLREFGQELAKEKFLTCATFALRAGCDFVTTADVLRSVSRGTHLISACEVLRRHAPREGYAAAMARTGSFLDEEVSAARVGEQSGTLALQFEGMAERARERIQIKIDLFKEWFSRCLYGVVAAAIVIGMVASAFSSP